MSDQVPQTTAPGIGAAGPAQQPVLRPETLHITEWAKKMNDGDIRNHQADGLFWIVNVPAYEKSVAKSLAVEKPPFALFEGDSYCELVEVLTEFSLEAKELMDLRFISDASENTSYREPTMWHRMVCKTSSASCNHPGPDLRGCWLEGKSKKARKWHFSTLPHSRLSVYDDRNHRDRPDRTSSGSHRPRLGKDRYARFRESATSRLSIWLLYTPTQFTRGRLL